ncbi:ABC transporter substrate-binding protein [Candidatus Clostridium stratigraminis]|uniref:ABC transporter substrate-binding protein n=1 Tax=Candidatus Clostridium stratigraminis TaxID=3381661 RepID=A0ABW8SYK2_9CLOT
MKKNHLILFSLALSFLLVGTLFTGCSKKNDSPLTKVKLNEVTRSIFYAPMYAAIDQGFFKAEGLEIELSTGGGAELTLT